MTTIKVPKRLRERIAEAAAVRGGSAASLLGELLDGYEREQRLAAVGRAYAAGSDSGYADETDAWHEVTADQLTQ